MTTDIGAIVILTIVTLVVFSAHILERRHKHPSEPEVLQTAKHK